MYIGEHCHVDMACHRPPVPPSGRFLAGIRNKVTTYWKYSRGDGHRWPSDGRICQRLIWARKELAEVERGVRPRSLHRSPCWKVGMLVGMSCNTETANNRAEALMVVRGVADTDRNSCRS